MHDIGGSRSRLLRRFDRCRFRYSVSTWYGSLRRDDWVFVGGLGRPRFPLGDQLRLFWLNDRFGRPDDLTDWWSLGGFETVKRFEVLRGRDVNQFCAVGIDCWRLDFSGEWWCFDLNRFELVRNNCRCARSCRRGYLYTLAWDRDGDDGLRFDRVPVVNRFFLCDCRCGFCFVFERIRNVLNGFKWRWFNSDNFGFGSFGNCDWNLHLRRCGSQDRWRDGWRCRDDSRSLKLSWLRNSLRDPHCPRWCFRYFGGSGRRRGSFAGLKGINHCLRGAFSGLGDGESLQRIGFYRLADFEGILVVRVVP